ncbi:CRE-PFD-3 protein [Aphelenchoides avenae]|nr:CRE-PFD-3 protein [Aphelenchus avenae]
MSAEVAQQTVATSTADAAASAAPQTVEDRMAKRGVPIAKVVEDVEQYLSEAKISIEEAQKKVDEDYRKYKYVEANLAEQKTRVSSNLPDYLKSLNVISMLAEEKAKERDNLEVSFKLDENVYSKAVVESLDKVCLWLGASVMVEYELEEAQAVLQKNIENVERVVNELSDDLAFVQDQITTTEVNMAHLYNYGIQQKRLQSTSAAEASK